MMKFKLNIDNFLVIKCCPLCGSSNNKFLRRQVSIDFYKKCYPEYELIVPDEIAERELLKCDECGLGYWNLIPKFESIPSSSSKPLKYDFSEDRAIARKASFLNSLVSNKKKPTILDVGCSNGGLLMEIQRINQEITLIGIDPVDYCLEKFHNITIIMSEFKENDYIKKNSIDLISMIDCFEHFNDLNQVFIYINKILKHNGLIYIETPNIDYWYNKIFKYNNINLFWLEHFIFINKKCINYIKNRYGLELINLEKIPHKKTSIKRKIKEFLKAILSIPYKENYTPNYTSLNDHYKILLRRI